MLLVSLLLLLAYLDLNVDFISLPTDICICLFYIWNLDSVVLDDLIELATPCTLLFIVFVEIKHLFFVTFVDFLLVGEKSLLVFCLSYVPI